MRNLYSKINLILLIVCIGLIGCQQDKNKTINNHAYLLPQLKKQILTSMQLSSPEGSSSLIIKNNQWWLDKPVNFPADEKIINAFLQNLIDAEIGKKINIPDSEYKRLAVDQATGTSVKLNFMNNKSITLIFGDLDHSQKSGGSMIGTAFTARRYVRVISEVDNVYLVPISLVDLTASATLWANTEFIRISSFKSMAIHTTDKTYYLARKEMFGPLERWSNDKQRKPINADAVECFEAFLREGRCAQIGKIISHAHEKTRPILSITLEDFLGSTYTFAFGKPEHPQPIEVEREALQANFLNKGIAPVRVPFLLSMSVKKQPLNTFEEALFLKNQQLAERFKQRIAFITWQQFSCLQKYVEQQG